MSFEARLAMEGFADPAAMDQQLEPHPASAKRRRATGARATAAGTPPHGDLHGCEQGAGEGGLKPDEEAAAAPRRAPGGGGGAADGGAGAGGPQGLPPTKHPLTPTVDEGLVNMGELVTEINGEVRGMAVRMRMSMRVRVRTRACAGACVQACVCRRWLHRMGSLHAAKPAWGL